MGSLTMIVVTTPTGNVGRQVLLNLLEGSEAIRVIARDPSRLPSQTRGRIEIVQGSHGDIGVVNHAFAGVDAVFWLVPADHHAESVDAAYVDFTRPACDAFRKCGVKRVVGVSALGRGTMLAQNAGHVTASLRMDDLIASAGVSYRALTMPSFMDNVLYQLASIKNEGVFFEATPGDLKVPTCATRDIAAVAARLLLDPSWSGQDSVSVLGPEDLSFNEMAQIMSEVLGRPVRFGELPVEALRARLTDNGYSEPMTQAMIDMMVAKNEGLFNAEPRTPRSTTPTTFRQWCEAVLKPEVSS